ncbi:MAG: M1 family metallopeptidase [Gemmataceae bacterium]
MDPYRLPRAVVPRRYDLTLRPDLRAATFAGTVTITVDVATPTTDVWLNAAELHVDAAVWTQAGTETPAAVTLDATAERCRLTFPTARPAGPATVTLHFRGTLNDRLRGFYLSRYRDPLGDWHALAATQFQATDARRAFPCWDEPAFKAVFAVTLEVAPGLVALSNTAAVADEMTDGLRRVRFADTIPLSPYLVAFIVGRLEATEPVRVGGTPVRVWCVPGKRQLAHFGLDVAAVSLRFFEEYYDLPCPCDKLDLIALPDFAAGAMENLGAITFRETALLVDDSDATHPERERVADVVAHENAHLWFGDLVTMRWWNGLWLNEAFATFLGMLAVDAYRPGWRRWTTFGVSRSAALAIDGLNASRPIEYEVTAPADADAMFDVLTYEKGASVLRMLEQHVGPDVFRAGVRLYLARHAYGNTDAADLWAALGEAAGLPVAAVMRDGIFRPGYPLVSVRHDGDELQLTQQRFLYRRGGDEAVWRVPVQVRVETVTGGAVRRVLLDGPTARVPVPADTRRILVNAGGHGFYRVQYDPPLRAALLDHLPGLEPIERFNLLNDLWATVLAGLLPLDEYLDLTARWRHETDRNVWSVLLTSLGLLARLIRDDERPALQRLVRQRLRPRARELGWEAAPGEDALTGQLRGDLLRALGTLGDDPEVQHEAALVHAGGLADPTVHSAAISVLAHTGGEGRYADYLARYQNGRTPQEEQRYLLALPLFRADALVARTLAMTLDGTVRTQDAPPVLRALLHGVHSRERAWRFVSDHWDELAGRFSGAGLRRMCEGILGLTAARWLDEVRRFFADRRITLGGRTLEQLLEQLEVSIALGERSDAALRAYLRRVDEVDE